VGQDPTPASLGNERAIEHVCRAIEADFYFGDSWRVQPGRQSDRGEIYLRYGPPALVRRNAEFRFPTWEWRYRTRGDYDTVFHFIDWQLNATTSACAATWRRLRRAVGAGVAADANEPGLPRPAEAGSTSCGSSAATRVAPRSRLRTSSVPWTKWRV